MLKLVFDLRQEVHTFMEGKGNPFAEFKHEKWTSEFATLVDITTHLNESDIRRQGKDLFIDSVWSRQGLRNKITFFGNHSCITKTFLRFPTPLNCNV